MRSRSKFTLPGGRAGLILTLVLLAAFIPLAACFGFLAPRPSLGGRPQPRLTGGPAQSGQRQGYGGRRGGAGDRGARRAGEAASCLVAVADWHALSALPAWFVVAPDDQVSE